MPRLSPDHRAKFVDKSTTPPAHDLELALWHARRGQAVDDAVTRALELHESVSRGCLRGWLLATSEDDKIASRTRLALPVIHAYRHLFFDVSVFRDHFDLVDWARREERAPGATPESNQYIRWAIMYGVEAIAYMSGLPTVVDPHAVQTQAMTDAHFRSLAGRESPIDASVAKEALKHQQVAVAQAAIVAKRDPSNKGGVAIRLKHRELTSSIEVVDKTNAEVLH